MRSLLTKTSLSTDDCHNADCFNDKHNIQRIQTCSFFFPFPFLSFPFLSIPFFHQSRILKRTSERIQVRFAPTDYTTGSEHLLFIIFPFPLSFPHSEAQHESCARSSFLQQAPKQGRASSSFCTKHPKKDMLIHKLLISKIPPCETRSK
jgi:hypothetical protein